MIIDQLTPTLSDNLTDEVPVEQGTATFKTTWQKILALFKSNTDASDIASTDGDVQTDIDDLQSDIGDIQSDIGDLQSDVDTKANKNGNNITNADTWVDALATASPTGVTTISDLITAGSGFTISAAQFYQWGRLVQLRVVATKSAAQSTSASMTIGTLKTGFRPYLSSVAVISSDTIDYAYVHSNGNLLCRGTWAANAEKTLLATYLLA